MNDPDFSTQRLDAIVREIFQDVLAEYDRTRKLQWTEEGAAAAERRHEGAAEQLRMNFWEDARGIVDDALANAGVELNHDGDAYKEMCNKTLRAFVEATRIHQARYNGDFTAQALDPLFANPATSASDAAPSISLKISEAYDKYRADKLARGEWRPEAVRENQNSYDLAVEFFGDRPVEDIQRIDVSGFRELIQVLPKMRGKSSAMRGKTLKELAALTRSNEGIQRLSATTVDKHMKNLSAFLGWAERQGYVTTNAARGVHKSSARKRNVRDERSAWNPAQLKQWFSTPFYQGCQSGHRRRLPGANIIRDHFYWIPLLAAFHPLRAEEIGQLLVTDIKCENGILFIDIDGGLDAAGVEKTGKQIKSHAAKRRVPVHSLLLDLGFNDYIQEQVGTKSERLFPLLKQGGKAKRFSQYFSRRFGEHIRYFGISGVSFHGLRHSAITALSEGNPNPDVTNELAGHKIEGERGRYRKGASLPTLKAAIETISYPEVTTDLFRRPKTS